MAFTVVPFAAIIKIELREIGTVQAKLAGDLLLSEVIAQNWGYSLQDI